MSGSNTASTERLRLTHLINQGRQRAGIQLIDINDASVDALLEPETLRALTHIRDPSFDPSAYPRALECVEQDVSSKVKVVLFYLRRLRIPRVQVDRYLLRYPADKLWVEANLARFPKAPSISILYVGMTCHGPYQRHLDDNQSTSPSRITTLQKLIEKELTDTTATSTLFNNTDVFRWAKLDQQLHKGHGDARAHHIAQDIERNLIALGGPHLANSSAGGIQYPWVVSDHVHAGLSSFSTFVNRHKAVYSRLSQLSSAPVDSTTTTALTSHFKLMADHYRRNQVKGEKVATEKCLEELIDQGTRPARVGSWTVTALVTKDITSEALKGGYGYDSTMAGRAPQLELRLRQCTRDLVDDSIDLDVFPRARTNIFACSSRHYPILLALLFLSQYLSITRPLLLVTHSLPALNIFQKGLLQKCWRDKDGVSLMSKHLRSQQPSHQDLIETLGREDAVEWDKALTYNNKTFLASLGTVSVVQYGPLSDDWCLYLPERHPGNGFYNPVIAHSYATLSFLTKVLYVVALHFVVAFAEEMDLEEKSGKEKRAEGTTFVTGLKRVRDKILAAVKELGLDQMVSAIKEDVVRQQLELFGGRARATHTRFREDMGEVEARRKRRTMTESGRLTVLTKGAVSVGGKWTEERRIQTEEILDMYEDMEGRGLVVIKSLLPRSCQGSRLLATRYLMEREEGRILVRSAQSSRPLSERTSVEGAEARHKAQVDAGQQQKIEVMNMIVVLAEKSVDGRTEKFRFVQCELCEETFMHYSNLSHRCSSPSANPHKPQLLNIQHMIYPHDVFNNATTDQRQRIFLWIQDPQAAAESMATSSTKQGRAPTANVSKKLQSKGTIRKVRVVGVLEMLFETGSAFAGYISRAYERMTVEEKELLSEQILFLPSEEGDGRLEAEKEQHWTATMALDALFTICNRGDNRPGSRGDTWASLVQRPTDNAKYLKYFTEPSHKKRVIPPYIGTCAESPSCGAFRVCFDTDTFNLNSRRHSCKGRGLKNMDVIKESWIWSFDELPYDFVRYLWYGMRDQGATDEVSAKLLEWSMTSEDWIKSDLLRGITPKSMLTEWCAVFRTPLSIAKTVLHKFVGYLDTQASERIWKPRCSATIAWEQTQGISVKDKTSKYTGPRGDWSQGYGYITRVGFCPCGASLATHDMRIGHALERPRIHEQLMNGC
ncbi:hypothetical protein F5H01DRAFT_405241 [Linnemannia elongata]|nr:hypothetical protein F5H01DRAFT_405241 [Linnemannia elongata]